MNTLSPSIRVLAMRRSSWDTRRETGTVLSTSPHSWNVVAPPYITQALALAWRKNDETPSPRTMGQPTDLHPTNCAPIAARLIHARKIGTGL